MSIDLISLLVGILSSLIAAVSVFFVKKAAKNILDESTVILKNEKGDVREVLADTNATTTDFRSYISDAINYEKSVSEILKKLNLEVEDIPSNHYDNGYDFLFKSGDKIIAVEVKSHKNPLPMSIIKDTINRLPENIKNTLFVSKSGFSKSSFEYVKGLNKNISLISGENEDLYKAILKAIEQQGITSRST